MNRVTLRIVMLTAFMLTPLVASADSAKIAEIRKLLKLTGAEALGKTIIAQMMIQFRQTFTDVPADVWTKLEKRANTKQLFEKLIPVYDRNLTHADIKGLVAFYQSPVGRRFVAAQPKLMTESMQIGQAWGRNLAQQMQADLKKLRNK